MTTAQRLIQEGFEKGLEEGRAKGREEGRAQGFEQGRVEGRVVGREQGLMDAARSMFANGIDFETVRACVALPHEQLIALHRQGSV